MDNNNDHNQIIDNALAMFWLLCLIAIGALVLRAWFTGVPA